MKQLSVTILCVIALLITCSEAHAELLVHAAASLTDALNEIGALYQEQSGEKVVFNFGASSILARQIQEGAPGDIFFSADEEKMDGLEKKGLIRKETRKPLLSNTLVFVTPIDSKIKFSSAMDLLKLKGSIAIAEPQTVPAGIYAKGYLKKIGIWSRVIDRLIPTDNVRAALAAVESGNVEAGIVYKTDAQISKRVQVAYEIPRAEGPKISYPIAILAETTDFSAAKRFYDFLLSTSALNIYTRYGFLLTDGTHQ
jgi:molybdate transport system substrate-binding protein